MWIGIIVVLSIIFLFVKAFEVKKEDDESNAAFVVGCRKTNHTLEVELTKKYLPTANEISEAHELAANEMRSMGYDSPCIPASKIKGRVFKDVHVFHLAQHTFDDNEIKSLKMKDVQKYYNKMVDYVNELAHDDENAGGGLRFTFYGREVEARENGDVDSWLKTKRNDILFQLRYNAKLTLPANISYSSFSTYIEKFLTYEIKDVVVVYVDGWWDSNLVECRRNAYARLAKFKKNPCDLNEFVYGRQFPDDYKSYHRQIMEYSRIVGLSAIGSMISHPSYGICEIKDWVFSEDTFDVSYLCQKSSDGLFVRINPDDKRIRYQGSRFQ